MGTELSWQHCQRPESIDGIDSITIADRQHPRWYLSRYARASRCRGIRIRATYRRNVRCHAEDDSQHAGGEILLGSVQQGVSEWFRHWKRLPRQRRRSTCFGHRFGPRKRRWKWLKRVLMIDVLDRASNPAMIQLRISRCRPTRDEPSATLCLA